MTDKVEFHFDFGSPNAYLAHCVIPQIEQRSGMKFHYVPVLLGGVFKLTGNRSPIETHVGIRNKFEYDLLEIDRFVAHHGLSERYKMNPNFPINSLTLMRMAVAAMNLGEDIFKRYVDAVFEAMWRDEKKMDDPQVVAKVLAGADLPVDELAAAAATDEVKGKLLQLTENSVERGSFGAPTFYVGSEIYFGKDRLRDVEEEISSPR